MSVGQQIGTYKVLIVMPYYQSGIVVGGKEIEEFLNDGYSIVQTDINSGDTTVGFNVYILFKPAPTNTKPLPAFALSEH